jgi:succinate-semialdehyde dehydrogenase/glutarate-semialdehyde dehydrogenase
MTTPAIVVPRDRVAAIRTQLAGSRLWRQAAYLDGQWLTSPATLSVVDPASGEALGTIPALGAGETRAAVDAATAAFANWRRISARDRNRILQRWQTLILQHAEELARILTAEQGKPLAEALTEVTSTAAYVEWFAEESRRIYGETIPGHRADKRLIVNKAPVGVVAAVTPWNFPSSMVARKVAPALAAGCTVVLKPSELTPYSALALAVLAEEAGVPPGVFNIVTGPPEPIGDVLTSDPRIRKFTFTGSTAVGRQLAARCMATVKRVSLELGGNAPFIVFADADLDQSVEAALLVKFRNAGQTCISANRLLVQDVIHDAFAARLAARAEALVLGHGLETGIQQGPLINAAAVAKARRHVADAESRGARRLTGGQSRGPGDRWFAPTVLTDVPPDALLCREETFAPVAGLVRFRTEHEAVTLANAGTAGLAAYVFTRDLARSHRLTEALDYGMVGVNTPLITTEVAPFGGMRQSGLGREGSHFGIEDYLDIKLVCIDVPEVSDG